MHGQYETSSCTTRASGLLESCLQCTESKRRQLYELIPCQPCSTPSADLSFPWNLQDIDAAYLFGNSGDLDADLSALLEVPDMFPSGSQPSAPAAASLPPAARPGALCCCGDLELVMKPEET